MAPFPSSNSSPQPSSASIVGREREQDVLRERLHAVLNAQGSLVLISGEAGIGKTTLVAWLANEARLQRVRVLTGHCYDLTLTPPYGPWVEAFADAHLADDQSPALHPLQAGADLGAISSQSLFFEQVREYLARMTSREPVLIVLEDLHWSDPASLDLLRHLARGTDSLGLLVIATYRADELSRQHPLFRQLPLLVREAQAERIDLRVLTDAEVHTLVARRYSLSPDDQTRLVMYLQSRAEGNPFYLSELLRTLETERLLMPTGDYWIVGDLDQAPLPPLVRQIIESRLAKLDDEVRRLLEIAAVIGQDVPLDVWQQASDAHDDQLIMAVERAREAHLILKQSDTTRISFTHALVRESLYHGQGLPRWRSHHRRVAEVMAGRADPPLGAVASHFEQADDPRAIDWHVRSGKHALTLYAARDAIAALTRAHELAVRFSRDLPLAAYHARASAHTMLGEFDHARRDLSTALERGRVAGNYHAEWQALVDLGMLWAGRDYERTGGHYRAALDLARSIDDKPLIAYSLNRIANWHVNLDEADIALPLHQEALAIFEACGDQDGIADTLDFLGLASYLRGDHISSISYYERAIALHRDLDDRQRLSSSLTNLTLNGGSLDDISDFVYREATFWIGSAEEGLTIAREIGWPAGESYALSVLGRMMCARGDLGRALRDAEAGLAIAQRIEHREWTVAARFMLGRIWMELFDPRRAEVELVQALTSARTSGSRFWTHTVAATLASQQLSAGNRDRATAILGTIMQSDGPSLSISQRQCRLVQAELALARDEPERTLTIIDQLISAIPPSTPEYGIPQLMKLRGDALARLRRFDEAEQVYLSARNGAALFGFRPLIWRVDLARGEFYRARGRTANADEAFHQARAVIEALAETISDEPTREQFRAQASARIPSVPVQAHLQASAARLSPRELDVLRLVVEGQSDREIAAALSISPRTVMRHVTGILNKLGVSSRTAAATLAIRQRIV